MKRTGIIMTFLGIVLILLSATFGIVGSYKYDKEFKSYWNLADKASTIIKKAENMDKFVCALENGDMIGEYNALILKTPDNNFDLNIEALKTLQQRLHEIKSMDVTSFEYQTAMQQITGQEQGEAAEMLSIFKGIWWKTNYFMLWNWIAIVQIILSIVILVVGILMWTEDIY